MADDCVTKVAAKWGDGAFHDIRKAAMQYVEQSAHILVDGQKFYTAAQVRGMLTDFAGHMSIESAERAIRMTIEATHDEENHGITKSQSQYREQRLKQVESLVCARILQALEAEKKA